MNWFDLAAAAVLLVAILIGYRSGATRQLGGLLGGTLALVLTMLVALSLSEVLEPVEPLTRGIVLIGTFTLAFIVGQALGGSLGQRIVRSDAEGAVGTTNRVAGAFVTAAEAIVLIWLVGGLLLVGPSSTWARLARDSAAVGALSGVAPAPSVVAKGLQQSALSERAVELFAGFGNPLNDPAVLPSGRKARSIAAGAEPSVVRIRSVECSQIQQGSGVVVAPEYVVTNAHVVQRSGPVTVEHVTGDFEAQVVAFNHEIDLAVLWVPQLAAPALTISDQDPERGAKGVAMGYPGGGPLTAVRASVNRPLPAVGADIFDGSTVTRSILELHAQVAPGDSGGPFIVADGTIGGIVFAESPNDARVGYALAAEQVREVVEPAIGRTSAVGTGSCT